MEMQCNWVKLLESQRDHQNLKTLQGNLQGFFMNFKMVATFR